MSTVDKIMELADGYAEERVRGDWTPFREALRAAITEALDMGEPVAWMYETEVSCVGPFDGREVTFTIDRWKAVPKNYTERQLYAAKDKS